MFTLRTPRLEQTPLRVAPLPSLPPGRALGCRLSLFRRVEPRLRRRVAVQALQGELTVPDAALDVVLTSSSDSQSVLIAAVGAVGVVLLVALGAASQFNSSGKVTPLSPSKLQKLLEAKETLLLDIRNKGEVKKGGSPALKGVPARQKTLPYTKPLRQGGSQIVEKFGEAFSKLKGVREDTVVILMDASGREGAQAAREVLSFNDFSTVYYLSGGATALEASGFPWRAPSEGLSLSLPKVQMRGLDLDQLAESYKQRPNLFNTGLALSALAAAGVVLFNEFDLVLEAVGVWGGANLLFKRFFFAEDREKSIKELRALFNDKIAASEAGDDLKRLASTILEVKDTPEPPTPTVAPTPNDTPVTVGEPQL